MGIREQIRHGSSRDLLASFAALSEPASTMARVGPDNPTRRRCEVELVVADGPSARGRVAAIVNPRLTDERGTPIGLLGFFSCDRNPDTARWLFDFGCEWLARRGCHIARGPIDFTTWHDYRLVTRTHHDVAIPGEPVHPPHYPDLWRDAGFTEASRYTSNWFADMGATYDRFAPTAAAAREAGFTLRPIQPSDLPVLHRLAMEAFASAYMYSPIELDEFVALYTPDRAATAAGTTQLAVAPDGEPLGFMYSFDIDHDGAPVGVAKTVAVSPAARGKGLYKLLFADFFRTRLDAGTERGIAALMHADGEPRKMGWIADDTLIKEYALYERSL